MNKKTILAGTVVLVLGGLTMSPALVGAYQGDPSIQGPDCTSERHEAMTQAFENGDYNAWKDQMEGKGRVTQVINEGNFARFAEARRLTEEGNFDGADAIRQELGLRTRGGEKVGAGYGQEGGRGNGQGLGKEQ